MLSSLPSKLENQKKIEILPNGRFYWDFECKRVSIISLLPVILKIGFFLISLYMKLGPYIFWSVNVSLYHPYPLNAF